MNGERKAMNGGAVGRVKKLIVANPAGNITAFVLNAEDLTGEERRELAAAVLAREDLGVQQLGFVRGPRRRDGLWRLDMAGGEFCGNAARAFGFYVACRDCLHGSSRVAVEMSGSAAPLVVECTIEENRMWSGGESKGFSSAAMPLPQRRRLLVRANGEPAALYAFEGICHVVSGDVTRREEVFAELKTLAEAEVGAADAFGVLFHDGVSGLVTPLVWVRALDTLVYESSCGSGAAAFACEYFATREDVEGGLWVKQPGGLLGVQILKLRGEVVALVLKGAVSLMEWPEALKF
ncbi:MAG: hypothetical protein LBS82_04125 [Spirochaetaceae bacterium]|jgi:diaminopimelate epimerase|nr:hypothetical protein [Spirochaetaceae bacterium]